MTERQFVKRADYRYFRDIPTRWMDNDVYGHVNNVVYYSYFDTAVNGHLMECGVLDYRDAPVMGIVVETKCEFMKELAFPDTVEAGIRVTRLGNSSVTYEIGLFRKGESDAAAHGHFVHVYVDRKNRRPVRIPDDVRAALAPLQAAAD
ncbi:MAG: acyl-CoA thioesterase [Alphaproteobacteria bacterium]|nr:acyl-CoA thioesterase [Alphaproteobacteria bacterium]